MEQRSEDVADSLGRLSKCSCEPCKSSCDSVVRQHPKVSLLVEMVVLPLEWVAKLKCVEFWYRVMKLGNERLVKHMHGSGSLQAERDEVDEGPKAKHMRDEMGGG